MSNKLLLKKEFLLLPKKLSRQQKLLQLKKPLVLLKKLLLVLLKKLLMVLLEKLLMVLLKKLLLVLPMGHLLLLNKQQLLLLHLALAVGVASLVAAMMGRQVTGADTLSLPQSPRHLR